MPAPTKKRPEEREFVVDSGVSVYTMNKKELSSEEMDTLGRSRNHTVKLTANERVHKIEEAQVRVHDLNLSVTVQVLEGNACYSIAWNTLRRPQIFQ